MTLTATHAPDTLRRPASEARQGSAPALTLDMRVGAVFGGKRLCKLTDAQARIVAALASWSGHMTLSDLIARVYPDPAPGAAAGAVRVQIHRIRQAFDYAELPVTLHSGWRSGYWLDRPLSVVRAGTLMVGA